MSLDGVSINCAGNYTDTSIPVRGDDSIVDEYTKYVLDGLDTQSWPSQAAPLAGQSWLDMGLLGNHAPFYGSVMPGFSGGGMTFDANTPQRINLPAPAKVATTSEGFAASLWIDVQATNALSRVAGWFFNLTGAWGLYCNGNLQYVAIYDGNTSTINLTVGRQHILLGRCSDGAGGHLRRLYRNGVISVSSASGATAGQPSTPPALASLGDDANAGFGGNWNGKIYRHWLGDAGIVTGAFTVAYLDALAAKDWNDNKDRAWA